MWTNKYIERIDKIDLSKIIAEETVNRYDADDILEENCFIETELNITGEGITAILNKLADYYGIVALDDNYYNVKEEIHEAVMNVLRKECLKGTFTATK